MSHPDIKKMSRNLKWIEDANLRRLMETIVQNIDIIASHIDSLEEETTPDWLDVVLQNSWVQYGAPYPNPGYYKKQQGDVHLRGSIKSGTATPGTVLFTLPAGYRPYAEIVFPVSNSTGFASISVLENGDVEILSGTNVRLSLDGVIFDAYR